MNKYNISIIVLAVMLTISSCSESFLDVESKTESTTGNFYKTVNDARRALYACYDGWQCSTSNGGFSFYVASEVMADECFGATGNTDAYTYQAADRFDISLSPSDMNMFETIWTSYYAGVYRCNELIAHEEQINWGTDDSIRGTYMGECRTIRALLYFDMIRLWGNIPLFTEPVNENKTQADPDDVYAIIVEDLKYAINNIPADAYPKAEAASNDGHISKYAAEALLARVYL
ncbi:MAG: RagB/SusD family nutrient uptake outer membrane protein, partial [Tannerellaceae bacterium]|nr:RagB/SusD family nutrient uptake outer membrane protein [Tannerellaceae bacterium]